MKEISTGGFKIKRAHIISAIVLYVLFIPSVMLLQKISIVPYEEKAIVVKKEFFSERIDTKIDSVYNDKGKLIYQGIEELTEGKCYITARSVKDNKVHRIEVTRGTFDSYHLKDTCIINYPNRKTLRLRWKEYSAQQ